MKQLEKQARRAKKYLKLKGEYKESTIILSAHNLSSYKERYENLKELIQSNQATQTELYAKINGQAADIERRKMDIQKSEGSLTEHQKAVRSVENELVQVQSQIELLTNEIKYTTQDLEKEKTQALTNADRIADMKKKLVQLETAMKASQVDISNKEKEAIEADSIRRELSSKMKNVEEVKNELLQQQTDLNGEITSLERTLAVELNRQQSILQVIDHTKEELDIKTNRLKALDVDRATHENKLDIVQSDVEGLEAQFKSDQSSFNELKKRIDEATSLLIELNRSRDARQNEFDLLQNMIENLEGYPDSIKFLAKEYKWNRKSSLLSEIIICQEAYKNAIEAVLEPFLNYYVVQGRDEAVAAITLLKDAQKGRAAFFDSEAFFESEAVSWKMEGFVQAVSVVDLSPEYRGLIHSLLGHVYIHDGKSPFDHTTTAPPHITLVAHDGHRIQSGHRLSGGSPGLFDGMKIGRKKNLEKIQEEIADLSNRIEIVSLEKSKLVDKQAGIDLFEVQNQLDARRSAQATMESEFKNMNFRLRELEQNIVDDNNRIVTLLGQKAESKKLSQETGQQIEKLKSDYNHLIAELSGESSVIDRLAQELSQMNDIYSQKNIAFVQAEGQFNNQANEREMILGRIDELSREVESLHDIDKRLSQKLLDDGQKLEGLKARLKEIYLQKDSTSEELSISEQAYFSTKNQLLESEKLLTEFNKKNSDLQYLITSLKDEYNDIKIKLNDVSQRVKVEFNVNTQELMQIDIPEDINGEELTQKVEHMRMKLYGFGEVNPLAVEAYNEMKERHEGISAQKKDIEDAQQSLLDTIKELEDQATIQFMEAFEQIKEHFKEIFRSLFSSEDTCDLILLDPQNPLESTIEVTAKPKGKRPLSLSQLSGGEKTLTATALLFALYLLKPAPFCIFDEVDAPLDDSNITKFNNIINTFAGDSQFLIITHNKLTMAAVDVIYGVYMDEPGVSSVTPVDFRELKHEMIPLELSEN
jgi:chromosome segregation protein